MKVAILNGSPRANDIKKAIDVKRERISRSMAICVLFLLVCQFVCGGDGVRQRMIGEYTVEEFRALPREKQKEVIAKRREAIAQRREALNKKRMEREKQKSASENLDGGLSEQVAAKRVAFNATRPQIGDAKSVMRISHPPSTFVFDLGNSNKIELVGIGVGSFVMGVPMREPMMIAMIGHKVTFLDPYWIGKFEVTQTQFTQVCGEIGFSPAGADLPACGISWDDAMSFAEILNDRFADQLPEGYSFALPTEAQWEFACRAGKTEDLSNGVTLNESWQRTGFDIHHQGERVEALDSIAWYEANSGHALHPVGLKRPNDWGLYDMHGNVSEWCLDWDGDPHLCLTQLYYGNNVIDQQGPTNGVNKVLRGGSYLSMPGGCTSWSRSMQVPDMDASLIPKGTVGFRLALARPSEEQPDMNDRQIYGADQATEDMAFLNALTGEMAQQRKSMCEHQSGRHNLEQERIQREHDIEVRRQTHEELARKREESRQAIEKARRMTAILGVVKTLFQIARPVVEFQAERGVRAALGQDVGKPWEGFSERIAEEWGMSDDVAIVSGDGGSVVEKRPNGLPTIKGKSYLKECESSTYQLYIGGTKITSGVQWASAGTSITVSNAGSHARAMAGNPPVRSGTFRTGIKATYNGKTYTKWITIKKTGKSAKVYKYKKRK